MTVRVLRNQVGQFYLEDIPYQEGRCLVTIGWRWARGLRGEGPGAWFTDDERVARNAANRLGQPIIEAAEGECAPPLRT